MNASIQSISSKSKWWTLAAITLTVIAVGVDQTVLSIALPTLAADLHASTAELQWFIAAFSLAMCAVLLPAGLLGDLLGRKRMLLAALAVFGAGSVLCAFSPTPTVLILARVVLGIGAAFLVPLSMSILPVVFDETERPRAVGIWAAANFLSLPVGPILGGWLLTRFWWGSVFLINVPVVILALLAVAFLLPESRSQERPGLDPTGVLLSSAGMAGVVFGVIEAGQDGWGTARALVPLALGALLLAAFGGWEARLGRRPGGKPLVDLSLFRSRSFTWGTILAALAAFSMSGILFTLPQYFQAILGSDAMSAGVRLLPVVGGLLVGAVTASRFSTRVGPRATTAVGFALMAAALAAASTTTAQTAFGFTAAWVAVAGAGLGFSFAASAAGAINSLPAERSGVGSAVMQAVQKVGVPFGAAILGSIFNSVYQGHLALGGLPQTVAAAVTKSVFAGVAVAQQVHSAPLLASVRAAFVSGMDAMLRVCAGVTAASVVIAFLVLPGRRAVRGTGPGSRAVEDTDASAARIGNVQPDTSALLREESRSG